MKHKAQSPEPLLLKIFVGNKTAQTNQNAANCITETGVEERVIELGGLDDRGWG
jgi:hypothetical protein